MRRTLLILCLVVLAVVAFFPFDRVSPQEIAAEALPPPPAGLAIPSVGPLPATLVVDLVADAGLPPLFVDIARCESSLDPAAVHLNRNGSRDHGLWQINDRWWAPLFEGVDPYDPAANAAMAAAVYEEQGLDAWAPSQSCWDTGPVG